MNKLTLVLLPLALLLLISPPLSAKPGRRPPPGMTEPDPEPGPAVQVIPPFPEPPAAVAYETCAVDPAVIPLGSVVMVAYDDGEVRTCRAEDTGSGVRGNHIDVCVAGHEEAKALGVRQATVYWEELIE